MVEHDILDALRDSYKDVQSRKTKFGARTGSISSLRRYLMYFTDILDIYLSIQRDRRWRRDDRDDW